MGIYLYSTSILALGIATLIYDIYALKIHEIDPHPLAVKQGSQLALFASLLGAVGFLIRTIESVM